MFEDVTEAPGDLATSEQLARIYQRYRWAAERCRGKDAAEVACGFGLGLSLLRSQAKSLRAGDVDRDLVRIAQSNAPVDVDVVCLDAASLPYEHRSLDVLMMFEAIYYLPDASLFFREAQRVLRENGQLLLVTVNPSIPGFHKSRFSQRYFTAKELRSLLEASDFSVQVQVAWPAQGMSKLSNVRKTLKLLAVGLGLMPQSKSLKQILKRLFFGKLQTVPKDISDCKSPYVAPNDVGPDHSVDDYLVLYVTATKQGSRQGGV